MSDDEPTANNESRPAVGAPVEPSVRPAAWRLRGGLRDGEVCTTKASARARRFGAVAEPLWPQDCRLCSKFTAAGGGCNSTAQCVDGNEFKPTAPRQYWKKA